MASEVISAGTIAEWPEAFLKEGPGYKPEEKTNWMIRVIGFTTTEEQADAIIAQISPLLPPPQSSPPKPIPEESSPETPLPSQPSFTFWGLPGEVDPLGALVTAVVAAASLAVWIITSRGRRSKRKRLKKFLDEIDSVYTHYKMNARYCEAQLHGLKRIIEGELKDGKIEENTYEILEKRLDSYIKEIQREIVEQQFGASPTVLRNSLHRMIEGGGITKRDLVSIEKMIKGATELSDADKAYLRESLERWRQSYTSEDRGGK